MSEIRGKREHLQIFGDGISKHAAAVTSEELSDPDAFRSGWSFFICPVSAALKLGVCVFVCVCVLWGASNQHQQGSGLNIGLRVRREWGRNSSGENFGMLRWQMRHVLLFSLAVGENTQICFEILICDH